MDSYSISLIYSWFSYLYNSDLRVLETDFNNPWEDNWNFQWSSLLMMNQKINSFCGTRAQFFLKSDEDCWKNLVNLIEIKLNSSFLIFILNLTSVLAGDPLLLSWWVFSLILCLKFSFVTCSWSFDDVTSRWSWTWVGILFNCCLSKWQLFNFK